MLPPFENENLKGRSFHTQDQWSQKKVVKVSHGHGQLLEAMTTINLKP